MVMGGGGVRGVYLKGLLVWCFFTSWAGYPRDVK